MSGNLPVITPDWPAPAGVRAAMTLRAGGVSRGPYASFNLGSHVGDDEAAVAENRRRLRAALALPGEPRWLRQVHGTAVARLPADDACADAAFTTAPGQVCAVLTADCLPVLLCDEDGAVAAVAHAGWRGLAAGVLERTVAALPAKPSRLMAWLGAAIGPQAFEVGDEVRAAFTAGDPRAAAHFVAGPPGKWRADLYGLARDRLGRLGIPRISGGEFCTFTDTSRFYSFRRDGTTGRMAALIWLDK